MLIGQFLARRASPGMSQQVLRIQEELDQLGAGHPVFLQEAYYRVYMNGAALQALGITDQGAEPDWLPKAAVVRDASGRATGVTCRPSLRSSSTARLTKVG